MATNERVEKYAKAVELADAIIRRIGQLIAIALEQVGNPDLVKAVLDKPRIKTIDSLVRKAREREWPIEEAIEKCWDFVGFRIVCNNLQDVARAADIIEGALERSRIKSKRHDYITKPQETGYRAIHLALQIKVGFGEDVMKLGCEIQIRTRLQDSWGVLSREEFYRKKIPTPLLNRMKELAESLAEADLIAEEIRSQVAMPRRGEKPPAGSGLTPPAIAFIFNRAFGRDPSEYVIERTQEQLGGMEIRADALDGLLHDKSFIGKVETAYCESTFWKPFPERIFECAVQAVLNGTASGIALARKRGKEAWAEIDAQYKNEISYAVPDTWDELRNRFREGIAEISTVADYFDATDRCSVCGSEIANFDFLIESVIDHYGLNGKETDEASELIISALNRTNMDDADGTGLCSYCYHSLNKND